MAGRRWPGCRRCRSPCPVPRRRGGRAGAPARRRCRRGRRARRRRTRSRRRRRAGRWRSRRGRTARCRRRRHRPWAAGSRPRCGRGAPACGRAGSPRRSPARGAIRTRWSISPLTTTSSWMRRFVSAFSRCTNGCSPAAGSAREQPGVRRRVVPAEDLVVRVTRRHRRPPSARSPGAGRYVTRTARPDGRDVPKSPADGGQPSTTVRRHVRDGGRGAGPQRRHAADDGRAARRPGRARAARSSSASAPSPTSPRPPAPAPRRSSAWPPSSASTASAPCRRRSSATSPASCARRPSASASSAATSRSRATGRPSCPTSRPRSTPSTRTRSTPSSTLLADLDRDVLVLAGDAERGVATAVRHRARRAAPRRRR